MLDKPAVPIFEDTRHFTKCLPHTELTEADSFLHRLCFRYLSVRCALRKLETTVLALKLFVAVEYGEMELSVRMTAAIVMMFRRTRAVFGGANYRFDTLAFKLSRPYAT